MRCAAGNSMNAPPLSVDGDRVVMLRLPAVAEGEGKGVVVKLFL